MHLQVNYQFKKKLYHRFFQDTNKFLCFVPIYPLVPIHPILQYPFMSQLVTADPLN